MDYVVVDRRSFGWAQGIYSPHVAQYAVADVVHVVVVNFVAFGQAVGVPPTPADRNRRVVKVTNVIMCDLVVAALADPYTDGTREDVACRMNDVIVCNDMACTFVFFCGDAGFADSYATRTEVVHERSFYSAVATALSKPHSVGADVGDPAILDGDVPRTVRHYRCVDWRGCL